MKAKGKTTFSQLLQPIMGDAIKEKIRESGVDKYVKKLFAFKLLIILIYAMLHKCSSLRNIESSFLNEDVQEITGLESISHSQISRRLRALPPSLLRLIYSEVVAQLQGEIALQSKSQRIILSIIDSSVVTCAVQKYPWAVFRKTKAGIKLHLKIKFDMDHCIPDANTITTQTKADKTQMDSLIVQDEDTIYVIDRAYVDYEKFDQYCADNILFVTRLKKNAVKTVIEEYPPQGAITKCQKVLLGGQNKRMENPLLLLETKDSEGNTITIITNDFQRESAEIAEIYRKRWQIEIFFKWIKQHLEIKHFYGTSPRAVENQLLVALITYSLLLLKKLTFDIPEDLLKIKRCVIACLFEEFRAFLSKIFKRPQRTSKGRRKVDYVQEFERIERQVMFGEADHLLMV